MCVCNVPYLLNVACPLNKVLPSSMLRCYSHTYTRTHARMQLATRHATPGGVLMVSNGRGNNACRKFKRNIYTLACLPFEQAVPMLSDARLPAVEHLLSWHFAGPPGQYSPQSPGRYRRTDLLVRNYFLVRTVLSLQVSTVLKVRAALIHQVCSLPHSSGTCSLPHSSGTVQSPCCHQVRAVSLLSWHVVGPPGQCSPLLWWWYITYIWWYVCILMVYNLYLVVYKGYAVTR